MSQQLIRNKWIFFKKWILLDSVKFTYTYIGGKLFLANNLISSHGDISHMGFMCTPATCEFL